MEVTEIYKALADLQRVRLLNLIQTSPLCVCHLQGLLNAPQVKISKQLAYLKTLGLAEAERRRNWMIYRMKQPVHRILNSNLEQLREAKDSTGRQLQADLRARTQLLRQLTKSETTCPEILLNTLCKP
ncbi:MAG: Arsenic resistance transcriptional regulator ArsR1 [Opitutia bacterium UBA7350]|nr:MAG: Arsenic resistance transcriptional regulator ArsR1 [Opitutae bacterium UBA7350]